MLRVRKFLFLELSPNWSPTGLKRQDNDVRYEYSPAAAQGFEEKFNEMCNRAGNVNAAAVAVSWTTIEVLDYRVIRITERRQ